MLNSKDKIVQHLREHFSRLGVGIEFYNNKLIIKDNLLNLNIIIHIIIALLAIEFTARINASLYISPLLFLYASILYVILWIDYKSINTIEFDLLNKNFSVTNRSVLRRLVTRYFIPQPSKFYFDEIAGVEENGNGRNSFNQVRHFVNIRLKNGEGIGLISFSDQVNSILFSKFVAVLID